MAQQSMASRKSRLQAAGTAAVVGSIRKEFVARSKSLSSFDGISSFLLPSLLANVRR
jgi:hypothetical protein